MINGYKINRGITNMKKRSTLYMGKYLLAFYNSDDELVALFDNPREMAEKTGKGLKTTKAMVSHLKTNRAQYMRINGQLCKLYLIEEDKEK